jgi:hypothetical protein
MNIFVPSIFLPRELRSKVKFSDLSSHDFSPYEKSFLCNEMQKKNEHWKYQIVSVKAISRRYNIHSDGLRFILKLSKLGIPFYSGKIVSKDKRQIDDKGAKRIASLISISQTTELELYALLQEEIDATVHRKRIKLISSWGLPNL